MAEKTAELDSQLTFAIIGAGPTGTVADPLPQAMALTAIVITFAVMTMARARENVRLVGAARASGLNVRPEPLVRRRHFREAS